VASEAQVSRPKPLVFEQNGVRVAVAVQLTLPAGCGFQDGPSRREDRSSGLEEALDGSMVVFAHGCRLAATWAVLGVGRAVLLALNVVGLLGAQLARGYLLGWAHMGGTHRQLSRQLSPWLSETQTPTELPYLVAEVLERPKSIPPPLPKRLRAAEALAIERKRLNA
jgi:hypothetical protein